MIKYITLESDCGRFRIFDSITEDNHGYLGTPCFQILDNNNKEVDYIDNPYCLINGLYPYLQNRKGTFDWNTSDFEETDNLCKNHKEVILELFDKAFEMGILHKELLKNKENI